jgi:hypothetical protein
MTPDIIITEITETMNPDEIVEVLDVDIDILVEALRDLILDNAERFIKHLELDE